MPGELGVGVASAYPACAVGKGFGEPTIRLPFPFPGQILTFWTLIMRGLWGLSFPLPAPTRTTSSTSSHIGFYDVQKSQNLQHKKKPIQVVSML